MLIIFIHILHSIFLFYSAWNYFWIAMHNLFLFAFSLSFSHTSLLLSDTKFIFIWKICAKDFLALKFSFLFIIIFFFNGHSQISSIHIFSLPSPYFFFLLLLFYIYKLFLDYSSHISQIIHTYICVDSSYFSLTLFIYIGKKFCSLFTFFRTFFATFFLQAKFLNFR